ncbi:MAG TPA: flagellar hook-associated protein FlgK [Acidiferrobacterales bacterium]|nr:flagellar hook-associated protein FlgK [Acidiferrobacterales bacterium]
MASGDLLGTSISGLLAFQRALSVTGHNVSNVNTPGYSRQRADLVTRPPTPSGDGFIGNGVTVNSVERIVDGFINGQMRAATAANGQLQEFYRLASQVDNLLADPQAGLAPSLQRFFGAVSDVANDPSSIPARQVLLSEAQSLADRFHYLDQRLESLRNGVNTQITNTVSEINGLASGIAAMNRDIALASGTGAGQPPNDLLDQRDELVRQLAERVAVTTVPQDDGALNVFIGNGQTLVVGGNASRLDVVGNPYDPTRKEVAITAGPISSIVSDMLTGGTLGGALQFRNEMLDSAQNALGRTAIGLAATFNDQHRLGQDLNNALGGDFFTAIDNSSPRVLSTSAATVSVSVSDVNALTTSDYRLDYDGATYTVTRLSDNAAVYSNAAFPGAIASEGLTFTLTAGVVAAGNSFLIQPTRTGARDIGLALSDVRRIAAAGPLRSAEATNASGVPTNTGSGRIGAAMASNTTSLPLAANITLTFDPDAGGVGVPGFVVGGGAPTPLLYNPATQGNGATLTLGGAYNGISFSVSGTPATGDSFVISNNTGGVSDNRNALALADLRTQQLLGNGTATYEAAYGQLVADVGIQTHRADINRSAQQALLNRVTGERESVSGVNLDEEAANLMRFQQAYQAAAQMVAVSDTVFQTLLGVVRR